MSRGVAAALLGALVLAACGPFPDARNRAHERMVQREAERARPLPPEGQRRATPAESACLNAAVAQRGWAQGIVGSEDVVGADGRTVAQRLVVNIARRPGEVMAWPCTYDPATGRVSF